MDIVLSNRNGEPMVSSREVAAKFGKRHDNVLKICMSEMCSIDAGFSLLNFEETTYVDDCGRSQKEILMTKDGFMFIAMGFTGSEAKAWKVRFLQAFNSLVASVETLNSRILELENKLSSVPELPPEKKKRATPRIRVPVYADVLPGFPNEPTIELKPVSEVKDPEKTISKISRLRKIAKGIDATIDSLLTHVGL